MAMFDECAHNAACGAYPVELLCCSILQQLLCRGRCRLSGWHSCEQAPLHTTTCSRAPDVSHNESANRPSKFSLDWRPSGAARHEPDRAPCCCVHRGASAAAVGQVATSLWRRSSSVLLKQMPNFRPVLDRLSTMPSSPRSLRRRCVRMRIRRRQTRSRLASLHSILGAHGT